MYITIFVTVDKNNNPTFVKRWRYLVPAPCPFLKLCTCLLANKCDVSVQSLKLCHGNSLKDIKNPFTGLHLPYVYIIQMKFFICFSSLYRWSFSSVYIIQMKFFIHIITSLYRWSFSSVYIIQMKFFIHIITCKRVWFMDQVFGPRSRGRCLAPLPRLGTIFSPGLMAVGYDLCAKFQEFSNPLRASKAIKSLKIIKKKEF